MAALLLGAFVAARHLRSPNDASSTQSRDPRAYEVDSGELTFDEAVQRAEIRVPDCARDRLRYATIDDGFGYYYKVYMRIVSSEVCVNDFLAANDMRGLLQAQRIQGVEGEKRLLVRESWMDAPVIDEMGWQLGAEQRFQEFSVGKSNQYSVRALVQHLPEVGSVQAYVYTFHGG